MLHTLALFFHRLVFRRQARWASQRLRHDEDEGAQKLAAALADMIAFPAEPPLAAWSERIEVLREGLGQSKEAVAFTDFGAQGRMQAATAAQQVTRTLASVNRGSAPRHEAVLLYHLIRRFQPTQCLELGTCLGISAAYQAAALAENRAGHLVSLEGGAALADRARRHLADLGLARVEIVTGRFYDTLPDVLASRSAIDFAFIDGHHNPEATLRYAEQLRPHLADTAVLVFDDIAWSFGMRRAWHRLRRQQGVVHAVDLLTVGLLVVHR